MNLNVVGMQAWGGGGVSKLNVAVDRLLAFLGKQKEGSPRKYLRCLFQEACMTSHQVPLEVALLPRFPFSFLYDKCARQ